MKKQFTFHILKCLAVFSLGLAPTQHQAAPFVEISAEIGTFGYRLGDPDSIAKAKPKTVSVVCITSDNEWRIENDFAQQGEDTWLFDGTNLLNRTRPLSAIATSVRANANPRIGVWESSDGHPLGHFGVNIPWLAFCSGTYLKREGRIIPLPAVVSRHSSDRYAYTDVTTTFADDVGLPRSMDLFTSKSRFLSSHNDWDNELAFGDRNTEWKQKTAANLQEGVLVFHYAVLETTNFLGRNFPMRFEFFQTGRPHEQDGNWFCSGVGRVKSIRSSDKPASLLTPGRPQTIQDFRFRGRALVFTYTSTNAFISPTNDPMLQKEFVSWMEWPPRK